MNTRLVIPLLFITASIVPVSAADKIEDFLGVKFGATAAVAKEAMLARGSKLKDAKTTDVLTFTDGTYAGERITELEMHFTKEQFDMATVTLKYSTGKSAEKGMALYESIRKSLTEKYGAPTTTPSIARGKNFEEKAKASQLETIWQSTDALRGEHRSITLRVPGIGMYDWTFTILYQDHNGGRAGKGPAPKKDV